MADTQNDFGVRQNGGANNTYLDKDMESDAALKRIQTAGSISISPELFEKLYLSPQMAVKGDLRKTFANPTPVCLIGFLMALTPTCINMLGWRGSGGSGAAYIGVYYWFGGVVMIIGSVLEFILGNTLTFVVFATFGANWLTSASTLTPAFNAYALYSPSATAPTEGLAAPEFLASYAFYQLFMGVLCFIFLICSLRTNAAFVVIFISLTAAFPCLAAQYWYLSVGNVAVAATLQTAAGSLLFFVAMIGWYILLVQLLAAVDMPFTLPLFDLSHLIISGTERAKRRQNTGYSA